MLLVSVFFIYICIFLVCFSFRCMFFLVFILSDLKFLDVNILKRYFLLFKFFFEGLI